MRYLKNLFWTLTKFIYLAFKAHSLNWISDFFNVYHSFISQRMKNIVRFYRLLSTLFITEYQINPLV